MCIRDRVEGQSLETRRQRVLAMRSTPKPLNPFQIESYIRITVSYTHLDVYKRQAIMSQSSLTPEQISDYTEELSQIYTRRAEITILLSGASMTPEQVSSYEDALSSIKDRKAMITARMAEDGLSEQELSLIHIFRDRRGLD